MRNKTIVSILAILFLVALFAGCAKKEPKITVACNLPLTGDFATYGTAIQNGAMLALDDLEKENPELRNRIEFLWGDNAGKANQTVNLLNQQLMQNPDIYVSGVKPQTMAIFDKLHEMGLPHFVWIFDAFITQKGDDVFRTWVNYKYEPKMYLNYAKQFLDDKLNVEARQSPRLAIIYVNFPHVLEEVEEIMKPELQEMGINGDNLFIENYNWEEKDFKNIVTKLSKFNPDLIIINGFQGNLVGLTKALRTYRMIKDGNVIATYDMLDAAEILTPDELEGIRVVVPAYNVDNSKQLEDWKSDYSEKYGKSPLYTDAYAYDMAMIISDAISRTEMPYSKEKWCSAIMETDIEGLTGRLKFDDTGDLLLSLKIAVFKDGNLVEDVSIKQ